MKNSNEEILLRVTFDNDFSCKSHVKNMCKKASKNLHALCRVCKYITQTLRIVIMKAFNESEFGYCPLVWIFHGTMNKIQERALRLCVVYADHRHTYNQLSEKD